MREAGTHPHRLTSPKTLLATIRAAMLADRAPDQLLGSLPSPKACPILPIGLSEAWDVASRLFGFSVLRRDEQNQLRRTADRERAKTTAAPTTQPIGANLNLAIWVPSHAAAIEAPYGSRSTAQLSIMGMSKACPAPSGRLEISACRLKARGYCECVHTSKSVSKSKFKAPQHGPWTTSARCCRAPVQWPF